MDLFTPYTVYFVSFFVFISASYYYGFPKLIQKIDKYITNIQDQMYTAEQKHQQAEKQLVKSQDKREEALSKAEKILKAARQESQRMKLAYKKELQEYEERQKKLGEEKVIRLERSIFEGVKGKIIEQTLKKSENLFINHSKI